MCQPVTCHTSRSHHTTCHTHVTNQRVDVCPSDHKIAEAPAAAQKTVSGTQKRFSTSGLAQTPVVIEGAVQEEEAEERAALGPKPTTMARQSSSRSASSSSQCSTSSFSDAESLLSLASEHMPPVGADNVASAIAKIQAKANGMSI